MPQDQKPVAGAQPAPSTPRELEIMLGSQAAARERRDKFAIAFGAAFITAKPNSTPGSTAKAVVQWVDAFLFELDTPKGA